MYKELAIISGKGGTGKTMLTLSMLPYFESVVIADCDVDAPDMKILLKNKITSTKDFIGFQKPVINYDLCTLCGLCYQNCNFNAITESIEFKGEDCEGCNVCAYICPNKAISMEDNKIGDFYTRDTLFGTMIDAKLIPGEESSGKLVSEVRKASKKAVIEQNKELIIIDGSPGIACNVISTISGVSMALIVTEPTLSGLHDLSRVLDLSKMFSVKVKVVINKYNLNEEMTNRIKSFCDDKGIEVVLMIPFTVAIVESISNLIIPSLNNDILFFKSDKWKQFITKIKEEI